VVVSGVLLIVDLHRPDRFWHMLVEAKTWQLMFKPYSPMSLGSWVLFAFGGFALVSFIAALQEDGRLRWSWARRFRPPGPVGTLVGVLGGLVGCFVTGYTGVLLAVTNRPIWSDTALLGLTFVLSAASTSAAFLILLALRRRRWTAGLVSLERFDAMALLVELVALVALVASLGSVARVWLSAWGLLLLVGVVIPGILVPLVLHWRPGHPGRRATAAGAVLVVLGGFVLRVVIVLSSEGLGV
jgi:protein NrfD